MYDTFFDKLAAMHGQFYLTRVLKHIRHKETDCCPIVAAAGSKLECDNGIAGSFGCVIGLTPIESYDIISAADHKESGVFLHRDLRKKILQAVGLEE